MNINQNEYYISRANRSDDCSITDQLSNQSSKNVQLKITRLDEHFLSDLKRKRKISTDSLESLSEELEKIEKPSSLQNVEQYLNETGLNVQLIAKNDKKLVKLNLNNNNNKSNGINSFIESMDKFKQIKSNLNINKQKNNFNPNFSKLSINLNDIDDLPSESDVSSGVVLMPMNNQIHQQSKTNLDTFNQQSPISLYSKCNKCSKIFNNESIFKCHQESEECVNSESENELEKLLLSDPNDQLSQRDLFGDKLSSNKTSKRRLFICNECGIQFYLQSDLNKHMLQIHQNIKPYQCSQCQMSFYELSSKNRHEKEHSGVKPFRCYICSFEFTRASNLRTHLLKVHPTDIGKLVNISKSADNKLKFEFDIEAINTHREQNKLIKLNQFGSSPSKSNSSSYSSLNSDSSQSNQSQMANTVIYIKDPNNKNADIQHMVVYVDGKPIFVQNPKVQQSSNEEALKEFHETKTSSGQKSNTRQSKSKKSSSASYLNKPVAKIPYLLAAAAAAAASNHRKQQQLQTQMQQSQPKSTTSSAGLRLLESTNECIRSIGCSFDDTSNTPKIKEIKHDQEYLQLVSMFKQKNEKLYNPLKTF